MTKFRKKRKYYQLKLPKNLSVGDVIVYMKTEHLILKIAKLDGSKSIIKPYLADLENVETKERFTVALEANVIYDVPVEY